MTRQGFLGLSVALAVAWGATPAAAGDDGPAVRPTARRGWTGGLAVGMGELHNFNLGDSRPDTISEGAAVSLRIGKALHQRTLFMIDLEYVMDGTYSSTMAGAYGQFYLSNRWWFRAWGGLTRLRESGSGGAPAAARQTAPAALATSAGQVAEVPGQYSTASHSPAAVRQKWPADGSTRGRMAAGMAKAASRSSSQVRRWISKHMVREALVGSVAWTAPWVRRKRR